MIHQVGFWHKVLNLQIQQAVTMTGANYLSPDMQPPDTMDVSMLPPEKILFTWNSMFGNRHYGEGDALLLGTKGAIHRDKEERVSYLPEGRRQAGAVHPTPPTSEAQLTDLHTQNFFDGARSRREPNCSFEIGSRSAIACQMAVASYREGRTVRWDAERSAIV